MASFLLTLINLVIVLLTGKFPLHSSENGKIYLMRGDFAPMLVAFVKNYHVNHKFSSSPFLQKMIICYQGQGVEKLNHKIRPGHCYP